jgi:leader peptidase (prepilin peptidase) / N-methyltransferase
VSSAGLELATIVSALVGALVAMRRSRRAQRTITKLDALALRKPINSAPIAILGGLLGVLTYRRFGFSLEMFAFGLMIAMCIEQSIIDYATHRLPRGVTFRAAIIGGPLLTLAAINHDDNGRIGVMFASFIVTLALFAMLSAFSKGGIGGGDVRLAPVLAMFLGWLGASHVYIGLGSGFILGGVVATGMLVTRRASASTRIAFGPFLCIGAVIALFVG